MRFDLSAGWSAAQVRAAERPLLDAGVPLMALASAGLAREVGAVLAARGRRIGRVLVLAGSGSNGGDALLAAARLVALGSSAVVVPLGRRVHAGGFAAVTRAGARVLPPEVSPGAVAALAAESDVVLDGILGTGASRPSLRSPAREVVSALAEVTGTGFAVVAVDLPSGVDPDDGAVRGPVLRADTTVTFGAVKAGLLRGDGRRLAGRIQLVDIGLGPVLEAGPLVPRP